MPATITLEHYEVLTREDGSPYELGRGAMGITYKGIDTRLRVPVALKVINAAHLHSESARQRFVHEARSAARLRHRNVASVFHLGEEGGNYFYAMEFIDGETLDSLVKRQGPLPPALALRIAAQVARALNAAQAHQLVHRDIKPSNLMAVQEDDDLVVKVIDFGLAKASIAAGESGSAAITQGGFLGTPHFASPEQLEEREIDVRSDIYSLGVTLWYLLRGNTPFSGSVARVMGQHLTKPPPFEELANVPAPIVELLRKMLAKDPAERPQTPAELRKEIERCLKLLREPEAAADAGDPKVSASSEAGIPIEDVRIETGATVARRYLIAQDLGENEAGDNFRARDLQQDRDVRLLVLHPELLVDPAIASQLRREAAALAGLTHPNVLQMHGLVTAGRATVVTIEWTDGFALRELVRMRRELEFAEVLALLEPAAAGLDYALDAKIERLDLGLHHVLIHFPGRTDGVEPLLAESVSAWPDFVVKINPLAAWRELFAHTWAAGQTLVGGTGYHERHAAPGRAGAIQALAAIAYELLGGVTSGSSTPGYTPLAALDEAGNAVMDRALFAPESFASATGFMRQFASPPPVPAPAPRPRPAATVAPPGPAAVPEPEPAEPEVIHEAPPNAPVPPPTWEAKPRRTWLVATAILGTATLMTAYMAYRFTQRPATPPLVSRITPAPTIRAVTPVRTPLPTVRLVTPTPRLPTPTPRSTPTPPTPTPPPTRRELATQARAAAETLEARQATREALVAWLKMARDFPEFDTGRVGLELLLNRMRLRPAGITAAEFAAMRPQIEGAAQLGVLSAMMILGEQLQAREPARAFAWFCAAAESGEPLAMTQAGLMLSSGDGVDKDLRKAHDYLRAATEKNEPNAALALADMYLRGIGVEKDEAQAAQLLMRASAQGISRAKNRLGELYHKGIGVPRNDQEAFRLFSEAAERGVVESVFFLGVLYLTGEGVKKDEAKAVEKFKEAALKGHADSMYNYAACLENGTGVKPNSAMARTWFQKAAAAGNAGAIEWCKANKVPIPRAP